RNIHARLLERLKAYAVKAAAFDILFDTVTADDGAFIQAVKNHGKVVLGARFTPVGLSGIKLWDPSRPNEELERVAAWGVAEVADEDEIVRQHYRVGTHSTNIVSLAWRTAQLARAGRMPDPWTPRWLNYYGPPGSLPWVSYVQVISNTVPLATLSNKVAFVGARIGTGFTGGKGTDDFLT